MTSGAKRVLFWAPRVLTVAFAMFLALFALDVFGEGYTGWRLLLALVMHLKWPAMVAAVLVLAWRWEWVGTVLFTVLGTYYWLTMGRHPNWILVISGPLFLIAALFLINWLNRAQLHPRPQSR
jgi:hypothetical protein